jgi:hypothetical protein
MATSRRVAALSRGRARPPQPAAERACAHDTVMLTETVVVSREVAVFTATTR